MLFAETVTPVATSAVPVKSPTNPVAVILPVLGLYVHVPSDSNPRLPPSTSPPAVKTIALSSSVLSLSVIVTVVATVATSAVPVTLPSMLATIVAADESVIAVASDPDVVSTALNLSSPSFQ